jgi:tetratricopeptide (TPR) repeat protein
MASAEKNFGAEHPTTAVSYSNLALVLKALGDYAGAKGLLEKAYAILKNWLGDDHPNTKIIRGNLEYLLELME